MTHGMRTLLVLVLFAGCGASGETASTPDAAPAPDALTCAPAERPSSCGSPASIVRGVVTVADGVPGARTGTLHLVMMHRRYGNASAGGHPHWGWVYPGVDLSEPFAFEIDMCDGNEEMWSEENCEYNLIAILDQNGNNGHNGSAFVTPDVGEAAALAVFNLSCHAAAGPCLQVELGCTSGASCISYEAPPACECAQPACDSNAAICLL
jgi:hypothetical protein